MSLSAQYRDARRCEDVARLRRVLALRAMVATGMSQRQIADALGISQPAVSQQLKFAPDLDDLHPEVLLEAAAPILKALAAEHGYTRLAAFGSVARRQARRDSDIDLIVEAPEGTSSFGFIRFRRLIEQVLGREVDLVEYGGLKPRIDDDIRRDAVLL
ncbi:MAG: nucleotidyltransferase domain-containing protein [Candidatus Nanopelagicales bacterium]|nr:nucleotidyltransferase domain-containing protein [Candidatus Nanopelagicales bacterium]